MAKPQKVSTCFWYDREAEEAAKLYVSLIPNSEITAVSRYGKGAPLPEGTTLMVQFHLAGTSYSGLNGGPIYSPTEAASIVVACEDQAEIDKLWNGLTANGGSESRCGWCRDRWGVAWQIVPAKMAEWMTGPNAAHVTQAFMPMKKLDIATLEAAARG